MFGFPLLATESMMALGALAGLGVLVGLGEALRARGVAAPTTRRIVHAGVSLFVASTPLLFMRPLAVYVLAALFMVLNATARSRRWWAGIHEARPHSWGTVALPLSVLVALGMTWSISPDRVYAFQGAYLVLALADPAASWVGEKATGATKESPSATVSGSLAFAGLTLGLSGLVLRGSTVWPWADVLVAAVGATLVATSVEAICRQGWDNLFVPLALILLWSTFGQPTVDRELLGAALAAGLVFGGLAYGADALNARGAVLGGLFATSLVGLGGVAWIVPGGVFFGLSSALTFLHRDPHAPPAGAAPQRTSSQVLANGGVAWAAVVVGAVVPFGASGVAEARYMVFVGALAAAAADTWATELGMLSSSAPWSLRTGRKVPAGTSGAVSLAGTGAAVLGAASVVGAAVLTNGPLTGVLWWDFGGLLGAGLLGAFADSIAGAFVQAQYRTDTGEWRETPPAPGASPVRGWARVGNNIVNVVGTTVGGGAALVGFLLVA